MLKTVDGSRAKGTGDLEYARKVVELMEHNHDLHHPLHHTHTLLKVVSVHNTPHEPSCDLEKEKIGSEHEEWMKSVENKKH